MSETEDRPSQPEILRASGPGAEQIRPGMGVVSIDGEHIGTVKEVREAEFLIDRPMARDLWAPFTAVVEAGEQGGTFRRGPTQPSQVVLSASAAHVDKQGWRQA
jgi:hypothetical protein